VVGGSCCASGLVDRQQSNRSVGRWPGSPRGGGLGAQQAAAHVFCRVEAHGVEARLFCGMEAWQAGRAVTWQMAAAWGTTCSFSVSWHGEVFHGLGVQGAKVSALPCALSQPAPASQQGP
jgi:hypothetical protein